MKPLSSSAVFPDAHWLWHASPQRDERDRRIQFRRTFELHDIPASAEIRITTDSFYTLWINGKYVNRGPARGFQRHWPFDRLETAPYLQKGKNTFAVLVYQYGISNYSYSHEWNSGFLLSGKAGNVNLASGPEWKFREAPGYFPAVARGSIQYAFQEFFDCRASDGIWQSPDYDDSRWNYVSDAQMRAAGCMPWHNFEERGIPLLTCSMLKPLRRLSVSRHTPVNNGNGQCNIGWIYHRESPVWEAAPAPAERLLFEPGINAQLLDFGKEVVGHLQFTTEGAPNGEALDFLVCESVTGNTPDFPDFTNPPFTLFGGRLILKSGICRHELTMPWGFRYLVLLRHGKKTFQVSASVRQTVYPLETTGKFHSSEERLNAIWKISEHTQHCCMTDAHIDCPWRENAQWWGDALVQIQNTIRLSADVRLFERGLRQIGSQKTPNGLTYGMAPTCGHNCILPDYSAIWIVTLLAHYRQTGTPAMWLEQRKNADGILNYFKKQCANANGLLRFDERYWLFLDWCPNLFKKGIPTVLNLFYLWALQAACELAAVTADEKRLQHFRRETTRLTDAIVKQFYDPDTGLLYDGITPAGEPVRNTSPHAAALAILLGILPEAHQNWMERILLPLLRGDRKERIMPSTYFMFYIFEAAKQNGYRREVIDCIRRWWGEFIDAGHSTTQEHWPEYMRRGYWSMCHAWSAHPLVHFSEIILGIRPLAPGWKRILFDPLMTRGEKASGTVPTPFGPIQVSWDWTASRPLKTIQAPEGIQIISPACSQDIFSWNDLPSRKEKGRNRKIPCKIHS